MRFPLSWLQEFVALDAPLATLADRLVMAGFEVASIESVGAIDRLVVAGRLQSVAPHPQADRLSVCRVAVGDGREIDIVSGAPGLAEGQCVPVALVGATLSQGKRIEAATLRGVASAGMLCSESELGLSEAADGVLQLPPEMPLGTPVADLPGVRDTILDIEIGPNRGDCLSVYGMAREIAALTGAKLRPARGKPRVAGTEAAAELRVDVTAPDGCALYCGRIVRGVTVRPSPLWLRLRLQRAGMRSINTLVDATNHVMLERGQPLHAFDWERVRGGGVVIRRAGAGERIVTLDAVDRALDPHDLVIADGEGPVALAGVMGGQRSEISADTKVVLLESAWFDPASVRRTVRRLGLPSQASYRFERRVDPLGVEPAIDAVAELIVRLSGGRVAPGVVKAGPGPADRLPAPVALRPHRAIGMIGSVLSRAELTRRLRLTGGRVRGDGPALVLTPPSWGGDLRIEADLVEEIARLGGYDAVPTALPDATMESGVLDGARQLTRRMRRLLAGQGLAEMVTLAFTDDATDRLLPGWVARTLQPLPVRNPLSADFAVMRRSPLAGLVRALRLNAAHGARGVAAFEIAKAFGRGDDGTACERRTVAVLLHGAWPVRGVARDGDTMAWADAQGIVVGLCAGLQIADERVALVRTGDVPFLHPGKAAEVRIDGAPVGVLGSLHPEVLHALDMTGEVLVAELDFEALALYRPRRFSLRPIPRFPAVARDIAVIVDDAFEAGQILDAVRALDDGRIVSARLFDCYRGHPIPDGKKSLAYTIAYRAPDRTLTDDEVNGLHQQVRDALQQRFAIELRS